MSRLVLYLFLFIKIIDNVSCDGNSSLTFVIDDTRSMKYDISQVRKEVDSIMDIMLLEKSSQIKDIVLVTFNDPQARFRLKTNSREEIKKALKSIKVGNYDNHDCPEASLEGIKFALDNSSLNSYIYVFTDATAKNVETNETIRRMCQYTQSQVTFVLTGDCGDTHTPGYRVYNLIASATGGQVYRVDKDEVDQVITTLKEMIKGKQATYLSQEVPHSEEYTEIPFTIDDKTEYAIVSASGKNVMLKLRGPYLHTKKLMWTKHGKVVKLINPVPGEYIVKVKGSESPNIVIYGKTDFMFATGFSEFLPKYFDDTAKQPVSNTEHHLSIKVEDPDREVIVEFAQILDMNGNVLKKMPLTKKDEDFYYTREVFISPATLFNVAVLGKVEKTGSSIKRVTSIPIEPQIQPLSVPDTKPEVSIKEGANIHGNYSGDIVLTCNVVGKPKPAIVWKDSNDFEHKSESFLRLVPNVFVSYLKLYNVKLSETYRCEASNILGTGKASISVEVTEPFTIHEHPSGAVSVPYGSEKSLTCDITSIFSMDMAWYISKNTKEILIESSDKYKISNNKKQLTITSMDAELEGTYTCKAWLTADKSTNVQLSVNITTSGLSPPILDKTIKIVSVKQLQPTSLVCRVKSGVPPATIAWFYQDSSSGRYFDVDFLNVKVINNTLSFDKAELRHSGNYKCIAKNSAGEAEHIIELIVKGKPEVKIDKTSVTLQFETMDEVTCKVTANPSPTLVWKDDMGNVVVDSTLQENTENYLESALKLIVGTGIGVQYFYCYAENNQGVSYAKLRVEIISPLHVGKEPEELIKLNYGKPATLYCNITSDHPLLIKWYKINGETNRRELVNPDKVTVLTNQSELIIPHMDLDLIGQYICEAELLYDKRLKAEYKMNVTIEEIGAPVFEKIPKVVEVKENEVAIIPCKLLKGIPPPEMIWEFMKNGSLSYERTSGAGQYLRISGTNLNNTGRYRCTAKNAFGTAEKSTDLIVYKSPTVILVEGTKISLKYGGTLTLTCKVTAHPEPKIIWKDHEGKVLEAKGLIAPVGFEYSSVLKIQNMKNSQKYLCVAENNQGTANVEVEVSVNPTFMPIPPLPETTNVEYGKRAVIPCNIDSDASVKRSWYRLNNSTGVKEPIVTSNKLLISMDGKELTIYSMDLNLEGQYSCEGVLESNKNEKKELKTNLKITGLVVPTIDKSITVVKVPKHDTAIINCILKKGTPKPTITWQYKTSDAKEFVMRDESDEILEVKRASVTDTAVYKCIATNVAGEDHHEIQLIVQTKPIIVVENDTVSYSAVLGDVVLRIPCKAIGNPTPVITWKRHNNPIVPDTKYSIEDGALIINEPVEKDSDEYICEARNDLGVDTKAFEARVTKYLEQYGPQHYLFLRVGETRKIECQLPYTDPKSVRWYLEELSYDDITGPIIELVDANIMMDGNYSCRVSDRNMSAITDTYIVDVGYPPILTNKVNNVKWRGGNDEVVDCDAEAKPWATAKWLFNGKPINNTAPESLRLVITNIGIYTCEVSNIHGSTGKNITVTASVCLINREDTKTNSPLILSRPYEGESKLQWPELESSTDVIIIESEDKVTLLCPSNDENVNKFLQFPKLDEIDVTCDHENIFLIDDKPYHLSELSCKETLKPVIVKTGKTCINNDTEWLLVGFNATVFVDLYKVCYDTLNGMPLHTSSMMFKMNDMGSYIDQDWYIYKGFEKGNEGYTCNEVTTSCCYAKQQFVNVLDVGYGASQIGTYIDHVNSVPIWQPCSSSRRVSWNQIEELVRYQLEMENVLSVWTGGSHFEENENGGLVPRYLWKIVLVDETDIVVVVYVNAQHPGKDDILCKNTCHDRAMSKWKCEDEYTYMCDFDDFLKGFKLTRENIGF